MKQSTSHSLEEEMRDVFSSSFRFYKASFREMLPLLFFPFLLIASVKSYFISLSADTVFSLGFQLFQIVTGTFLNAVVILFIYMQTEGKAVAPAVYYRTAAKFWPNLFVIYTVIGTIAGIGVVLMSMGLIPIIIPVIWIAVRLSIADIIYVVEKPDLTEALKKSFAQTENRFWLIFICFFVILVTVTVLGIFLQLIFYKLGRPVLFFIFIELLYSFALLLLPITMFRIYMTMKDKSEPSGSA